MGTVAEYFKNVIAPLANIGRIELPELCKNPICLRLATVRVERIESPDPMDLSENYHAEYEFCDEHYEPGEERDVGVTPIGEVRR